MASERRIDLIVEIDKMYILFFEGVGNGNHLFGTHEKFGTLFIQEVKQGNKQDEKDDNQSRRCHMLPKLAAEDQIKDAVKPSEDKFKPGIVGYFDLRKIIKITIRLIINYFVRVVLNGIRLKHGNKLMIAKVMIISRISKKTIRLFAYLN